MVQSRAHNMYIIIYILHFPTEVDISSDISRNTSNTRVNVKMLASDDAPNLDVNIFSSRKDILSADAAINRTGLYDEVACTAFRVSKQTVDP